MTFLSSSSALGAVYGVDSRFEIANHSHFKKFASGVAMSVSNFFSEKVSENSIRLDFMKSKIEKELKVCSNEKFVQQPTSMPSCTGFLIDEDVLVTAGHCMINTGEISNGMNHFCSDFSWIFDYQVDEKGLIFGYDLNSQLRNEKKQNDFGLVPTDKKVGCKKIIYAINKTEKKSNKDGKFFTVDDYAIIQLDRKFPDRHRFELRKTPVSIGTRALMIGFPLGLPAKAVANGKVLKSPNPRFGRLAITAFDGNSGSPVFDLKGRIFGVLVKGSQDFAFDKKQNCYRYNKCDFNANKCEEDDNQEDMAGEYVTPISRILEIYVKWKSENTGAQAAISGPSSKN